MSDTFHGYLRDDGQVGIRNHLLLLSGTLYANTLCERVSNSLTNCIPIVHPLGRCQLGNDIAQTRRTLVGHGCHPNAGAVIVADHFKEQNCTAEEIAHDIAERTGKPVEVVNIRADGGAVGATAKATRLAIGLLRKISGQPRQETPVSKLIFGINCGTSDVTSGLSHNRAVGWCVDRFVEQGGRAVAAETTEMMGGEEVIKSKCKSPQTAEKILSFIDRMEKRIQDVGIDLRGSQPTGDNMVGGLSTIEEKSIGAIQKWGRSAPIVGAVEYAEFIGNLSGLWIMDTPGHGGESITGIAASGAQLMAFSTGGGHTINHPLMTTIRLSGNRLSVDAMEDTNEVDVSDVFDGASLEQIGRRLYDEIIETCNGKMTKAEILKEFNAFAINRIGPSV
jgi:altronate dehydratase large subunit